MENINFKKLNGLIPVIIQENKTNKILMLGFMNAEAYKKTCEEKIVFFWSRTKKRLWKKGETSKNVLYVKSIYQDCDNDSLLILVKRITTVCHLGNKSCFERKII